jgi:hypothetical protein
MKIPNNSKTLVRLAITVLLLFTYNGCKKDNNSPSYYFTAEINEVKKILIINCLLHEIAFMELLIVIFYLVELVPP